MTPNLWNFQRVLHTLAATQEVPRHNRLHPRGSTSVPPTSRGAPFPPPSSRGGIISLRGRERIPGVPAACQEEALSTGKARGTPGSCHHSQSPPESNRCLDPREGKRDTAATAREESARACPHSRRGLTLLGGLQKYPKIHVSTREESSGSGTESKQDLRTRHRRERNPERPPSNSHGDWPFMRPPERVPDVPVVNREHLPQVEKIQEVLPSSEMRPISAEASPANHT